MNLQIALRGNAPLGAAHLLGGQIQGAFADHAACLVLQAVHPDVCIALATNDAAMVVEDECSDIQPSACGKNALRLLSSAWAMRRVRESPLITRPPRLLSAVAARVKLRSLEISPPPLLSTTPSCRSSKAQAWRSGPEHG